MIELLQLRKMLELDMQQLQEILNRKRHDYITVSMQLELEENQALVEASKGEKVVIDLVHDGKL